jgi:hypothetical protein
MRADAPPDPARGAGVEDALREIPRIMAAMLVAFGANGIRTVEDLAACATDDLIGWTERLGAQTPQSGILDDLFCRGRNATRSSAGRNRALDRGPPRGVRRCPIQVARVRGTF